MSVAVGDLNGDGTMDLVTANHDGTVSLFLGKGDGTFTTALDYAAASMPPPHGGGPDSVAVADLNRDGQADIAVTNGGSNTINVLLGSCRQRRVPGVATSSARRPP
jgi:hypothetical protein